MTQDTLNISLSTLIEVSTILGYPLEDRTHIRDSQDKGLGKRLQEASTIQLTSSKQQKFFYFGCLDFLAYEENGEKLFFPLEFNGTGTGGITNIPMPFVNQLFAEFSSVPQYLTAQKPIFLVPFYRSSRLVYEHILLAQSIKKGFQIHYGEGTILPLTDVLNNPQMPIEKPTVILGNMQSFIECLTLQNHQIFLNQHPIAGSLHDIFCENLFTKYKNAIDLATFFPINYCFPVCSNKNLVYQEFNEFYKKYSFPHFRKKPDYTTAQTREELIQVVLSKIQQGEKIVIKPHAAGVGNGIEFFTELESEKSVIAKIDASIQTTEKAYGVEGSSFPYTACEFIDSCTIQVKETPLYGHKFELRIIVYRYGDSLLAFPAHVKFATKPYDPASPDRLMLLNNYVPTADTKESAAFRIPITSYESLKILDLTPEELSEMCQFSTTFIQHIIEKLDHNPLCLKNSSTSNLAI